MQSQILSHLNIQPLVSRLMIHYCAFIHSLMKNNKCESLVNRFKLKDNTSLRKPYQTVLFDSKYQQYSLTCVGTKLLNKFIYTQMRQNDVT